MVSPDNLPSGEGFLPVKEEPLNNGLTAPERPETPGCRLPLHQDDLPECTCWTSGCLGYALLVLSRRLRSPLPLQCPDSAPRGTSVQSLYAGRKHTKQDNSVPRERRSEWYLIAKGIQCCSENILYFQSFFILPLREMRIRNPEVEELPYNLSHYALHSIIHCP